MNIAEKLQTIAENESKVYKAGQEAGQKAERDNFWDVFQNYGNTRNYYQAFSYDKFTDETYNPKYDIRCSEGTTPAQNMFYSATKITDTKVAIYANARDLSSAFGMSGLKTIRKLHVYESTIFYNTFSGCYHLENLTIDGVIGQNGFDVHWSTKLTHDSLISIIEHLADKSNESGTWTVTLGSDNKNKLTDDEIAIAEAKGWDVA